MISSRTPFRISFFSEGADYPVWHLKHGGTMPAAMIDRYGYLSSRHLPSFYEHGIQLVRSRTESCQTPHEITHPAGQRILSYTNIDRSAEVHRDGGILTLNENKTTWQIPWGSSGGPYQSKEIETVSGRQTLIPLFSEGQGRDENMVLKQSRDVF